MAEQDSNPSLLIPSCCSGFPAAFPWLPLAPLRRKGLVLKVLTPPASGFSFQEFWGECFLAVVT